MNLNEELNVSNAVCFRNDNCNLFHYSLFATHTSYMHSPLSLLRLPLLCPHCFWILNISRDTQRDSSSSRLILMCISVVRMGNKIFHYVHWSVSPSSHTHNFNKCNNWWAEEESTCYCYCDTHVTGRLFFCVFNFFSWKISVTCELSVSPSLSLFLCQLMCVFFLTFINVLSFAHALCPHSSFSLFCRYLMFRLKSLLLLFRFFSQNALWSFLIIIYT